MGPRTRRSQRNPGPGDSDIPQQGHLPHPSYLGDGLNEDSGMRNMIGGH